MGAFASVSSGSTFRRPFDDRPAAPPLTIARTGPSIRRSTDPRSSRWCVDAVPVPSCRRDASRAGPALQDADRLGRGARAAAGGGIPSRRATSKAIEAAPSALAAFPEAPRPGRGRRTQAPSLPPTGDGGRADPRAPAPVARVAASAMTPP